MDEYKYIYAYMYICIYTYIYIYIYINIYVYIYTGLIRDDEYYHQGLSWLLQQLSEKSEDARILLLEKGITFEAAKAAQTSRDALVYIYMYICICIYKYI
jgi:hypothetical protein